MNCQQVEELLAAYALDAVDADERREVHMHLASCDRHAEVTELLAVASGLAGLVEEREPPAGLEDRILAAATSSASPGPAGASPRAPSRGGLTVRPSRTLRWPAAIAAALLLFALGVATGGTLFPAGEEGPSQVVQFVRDGDAWMRASAATGADLVSVEMGGLAPRPPGERYQVWAVREDRWLSIGVCNTNEDGWWGGDFDFTIEPGDALAVTVEPEGGSPRPTGPSVLGVRR